MKATEIAKGKKGDNINCDDVHDLIVEKPYRKNNRKSEVILYRIYYMLNVTYAIIVRILLQVVVH